MSQLCLLKSELQEEIDALEAIYGSEVSNEIIQHTGDHFVLNVNKKCRPRTAGGKISSFVEAEIRLILNESYPFSAPSLIVLKSSGINKKYLTEEINSLLTTIQLGEPLLFQLFEAIDDILDRCNQTECMICGEDLINNITDVDSFKTDCNHTFHLACICRWGFTCIKNKSEGKIELQSKEKENLLLKSVESEYRTASEEISFLEEEINRLSRDIESLQSNIHEKKNLNSAPSSTSTSSKSSKSSKGISDETKNNMDILKNNILQKRSEIANEIQDIHKLKIEEKVKKNILESQIEQTKLEISELELQLSKLEHEFKKGEVVESSSRSDDSILESMRSLLEEYRIKKEKASKRIQKNTIELEEIKKNIQKRREIISKDRVFPCAICRQNINQFSATESYYNPPVHLINAFESIITEDK
eukprot:gene5438-10910_t